MNAEAVKRSQIITALILLVLTFGTFLSRKLRSNCALKHQSLGHVFLCRRINKTPSQKLFLRNHRK